MMLVSTQHCSRKVRYSAACGILAWRRHLIGMQSIFPEFAKWLQLPVSAEIHPSRVSIFNPHLHPQNHEMAVALSSQLPSISAQIYFSLYPNFPHPLSSTILLAGLHRLAKYPPNTDSTVERMPSPPAYSQCLLLWKGAQEQPGASRGCTEGSDAAGSLHPAPLTQQPLLAQGCSRAPAAAPPACTQATSLLTEGSTAF